MNPFTLPAAESIPADSRPTLAEIRGAFGFVPNLMTAIAASPAAVQGAWALLGAFDRSAFTPRERQLVLLAVSVANECEYCVAAHSLMGQGAGLTRVELDALRAGTPLSDSRLEALRAFATRVTTERGHVDASGIERFLGAGYTPPQVLEVVLGVTAKTLMNYADHIVHAPLDTAFQAHRRASARAA